MKTLLHAVALMTTPGLGRRRLADFILAIASAGELLTDAIDAGEPVLVDRFGLPQNLAEEFFRTLGNAGELASELERDGISATALSEPDYPRRLVDVLGRDAPPVLFVQGNRDLLTASSVGFCGSRNASEKGLRVAGDSARIFASHKMAVVSGYAAGVDLAAHRSAMEANGTTVFVLAEGIKHFRAKREIKSLLTPENHVVVSEFPPDLPWLARNAMQRNRTIIGSSSAMIVIESGTTGGTFACAEATLALHRPLFVADYATPASSAEGNASFIRRGALPLRGSRAGVPNVARILDVVQGGATPTSRSLRSVLPFDAISK